MIYKKYLTIFCDLRDTSSWKILSTYEFQCHFESQLALESAGHSGTERRVSVVKIPQIKITTKGCFCGMVSKFPRWVSIYFRIHLESITIKINLTSIHSISPHPKNSTLSFSHKKFRLLLNFRCVKKSFTMWEVGQTVILKNEIQFNQTNLFIFFYRKPVENHSFIAFSGVLFGNFAILSTYYIIFMISNSFVQWLATLLQRSLYPRCLRASISIQCQHIKILFKWHVIVHDQPYKLWIPNHIELEIINVSTWYELFCKFVLHKSYFNFVFMGYLLCNHQK